MDINFYDSSGTPIAYTVDGEHIYLFSGNPVAYLSEDSVYAYSGKHLGRVEDGWNRDNQGCCVFFTDNAVGGPMQPLKKMKPMRTMKQMKPMKGMKQMKPMRPTKKNAWSSLSGAQFFFHE